MVAALNLMFFVIIMVVLCIGIFIAIVALREDGIFSFRCRDSSADKTISTDKAIGE
jgi:hypothetical protein